MHRSWMKNQGMPADAFDGRPVIGICNTWSELTPCNAHLRDLAERVKRGVFEAGGSLSNSQSCRWVNPICAPPRCSIATLPRWMSRNRSAPIRSTAWSCLVGCDKTTPALVMGAASCDLPTIVLVGRARC